MKEEQIVQSARTLFSKYGYKKVSMDEIAKQAGVTKRTVYSYFSSKEELLKYFINEEVMNMKKIVEDIESENLSFFDNVHKVICSLLKYKKERKFLNIIVAESESLKTEVIIKNIKEIDKLIKNFIKNKLDMAVEKGYIIDCDTDVVALIVYKLYMAMMLEFDELPISDEKIADNLIQIIRNGLEKK